MSNMCSIIIMASFQGSESSQFCTLPRQKKSRSYAIKNVQFEKGPGKKSLGFTVVGGKDSPKGSIGIYVKSVFPSGQAVGLLREGETAWMEEAMKERHTTAFTSVFPKPHLLLYYRL